MEINPSYHSSWFLIINQSHTGTQTEGKTLCTETPGMSQRFQGLQDLLQTPAKSMGRPARTTKPSAGFQQWEFDAAQGEPSLGEGSLKGLKSGTGGKAKFHPGIPSSCCWASVCPVTPSGFSWGEEKGLKPKQGSRNLPLFPFPPHLTYQSSGFCSE